MSYPRLIITLVKYRIQITLLKENMGSGRDDPQNFPSTLPFGDPSLTSIALSVHSRLVAELPGRRNLLKYKEI
jgi:hypothetical protein